MSENELNKNEEIKYLKLAFAQRCVIIALLCIIAVILFVIMLKCGCRCSDLKFDSSAQPIQSQNPSESVNDEDMQFVVFEVINIVNGNESDLSVVNISENKVNIVAKLYLNGSLIYESGMVAPGSMVKNVKLKKSLSKGIYNAKLEYIAYDSYGTNLNCVSFDTKLAAK